jgi:hypothetical protein
MLKASRTNIEARANGGTAQGDKCVATSTGCFTLSVAISWVIATSVGPVGDIDRRLATSAETRSLAHPAATETGISDGTWTVSALRHDPAAAHGSHW